MSAPSPRLAAGDQPAAEALTDVFKAIEPAELDKHDAVLAYWLSIRATSTRWRFRVLHRTRCCWS